MKYALMYFSKIPISKCWIKIEEWYFFFSINRRKNRDLYYKKKIEMDLNHFTFFCATDYINA